jgi:hypothetical protein
MPDLGCVEAMNILNLVFQSALVMNDGHEILLRLQAGDEPADILLDLGRKFSRFKVAREDRVGGMIRQWPPLHGEAVSQMLQWALAKLDTDERVSISWKGDDEAEETVTRFELRGNHLQIEFAHPPAVSRRVRATAAVDVGA